MFPRAPLPERLGAYRVLRRLASPAGADVYAGLEEGPLGFRRDVVLKLVANAASDAGDARILAREAAVIAALNHENVVRMFDFFEHGPHLILVLERVEGTTLARLLAGERRRRRRLPDEIVGYVAHALARALAHAHGLTDPSGATPVVHRAVRPGAVLLGWDGSVRLSGFGLAKVLGTTPDTTVGLVRGSAGYMAPEQLRGERVTERTDVYQLGLVLWEMLAGEAPPAETQRAFAETAARASALRPAQACALRPSLPREVGAVIDGALEPDPRRRTVRCSEIARWLEQSIRVDEGLPLLRERLALMRGAARANRSPTRVGRRTAPRFPGAAVRATGRPSLTTEAAPTAGEGGVRVPLVTRPPSRPPAAPGPRPPPPPPRARAGTLEFPTARRSGSSHPTWPDATPTVAQDAPSRGTLPLLTRGEPAVPSAAAFVGSHGGRFHDDAVSPGPMSVPALPPAAEPAARPVRGVDEADDAPGSIKGRAPWATRTWATVAGMAAAVIAVAALARWRTGPAELVPPAPSTLAAAASSTVDSASAAPLPPAPGEPSMPIRIGYGLLTVTSVEGGHVYVNGYSYGPTETALMVPCGRRFVRVGKPPVARRQTEWLTNGVPTTIRCGAATAMRVGPVAR